MEGVLAPFYGCHMLGMAEIRAHDMESGSTYNEVVPKSLVPTRWTTENMKSHIETLLNFLPRKLDYLIIVHEISFSHELCRAVVEGVTKSTKVKVISPLMARFMFVTQQFPEPLKENQHIIILTRIMDLSDFHVLRRKDGNYTLVYEWLTYSKNIPICFKKYLSKYPNNKPVIIFDSQNETFIDEVLKASNNRKDDILKIIALRWEEMILIGALAKAATMANEEIKYKMNVADFTVGFQFGSENETIKLVPSGEILPCHFSKEIKVQGKKGVIRTNPTMCLTESTFKRMMFPFEKLSIGTHQVNLDIEEDGILHVNIDKQKNIIPSVKNEPADVVELESTEAEVSVSEGENQRNMPNLERRSSPSPPLPFSPAASFQQNRQRRASVPGPKNRKWSAPWHRGNNSRRSFDSPARNGGKFKGLLHDRRNSSSSRSRSPSMSLSPMPPAMAEQALLKFPNKKADFMLCFNDNYVCLCLPENGNKIGKRIKNANGNDWTPMYSTFSEEIPRIGEVARRDLKEHPDCVIYDLYRIIGQTPNKFEIDSTWPFGVAYTESSGARKYIVIELNTCQGEKVIDPVMALSLFFVGLRKEAEAAAGKPLYSVFVKKTKPVEDPERIAFRDAARYASLEFAGIESMPNIQIEETNMNL